MDTYELLLEGGEEGRGIQPGQAAQSNIIVRMSLPQGDDDHMPPEGKPAIEEAELLVIKWWLDSGADPHKTLGQMEVTDSVKAAIKKLPARAPRQMAK
jgi:hypothetical protein